VRFEDQVVKTRTRGVLVEQLGDELVVYDVDADRVHHLNAAALAVYQAATDHATVQGLIDASPVADPGAAAAATWEALAALDQAGLLEGPITIPSTGMDRRRFLRNLGIASVALPLVTTIATQSPAFAACQASVGSTATCTTTASTPCCAASATCTTNPAIAPAATVCCYPRGTTTQVAGTCSAGVNTACCSGTCATTGNQGVSNNACL
jgi:hypothetical protein